MDKGNPKRANGEVTHGKEGTSHLSDWAKLVEKGNSGGKRKGREKSEEKKRREKLLLLSSFPRDLAVCFRRRRRKSSSSRKNLRVGTGIEEFRQTPRSSGFSYSVLFLA